MVNCGVRLYTVFSPGKSKHVVSEKDYKRLYSPASGDEMNAQLLSSWRLGLDRMSKDALDRVGGWHKVLYRKKEIRKPDPHPTPHVRVVARSSLQGKNTEPKTL